MARIPDEVTNAAAQMKEKSEYKDQKPDLAQTG